MLFYKGDWVAVSKKDNKDIILPFHHDSIVQNEFCIKFKDLLINKNI